ncbi:hypothetical protein DLAC_09418 [Tieghemostelium lacteum]|uniref:Transmembrane protein n=1 Tax=Tieghemostelium lacteum TaxID=361077 RepID=A0A151ZA01_TIELA|nr:hypothetical protein DLAC_09418 [Tieghemostelium lacteum]|eukprot:KYQ90779.1 hypothetical protein DLAC_09418 [Tieghemostelium lacteum]
MKGILVLFVILLSTIVVSSQYIKYDYYNSADNACSQNPEYSVQYITNYCMNGTEFQCINQDRAFMIKYADNDCQTKLASLPLSLGVCQNGMTVNCGNDLTLQSNTFTELHFGDCSQSTEPIGASSYSLGLCLVEVIEPIASTISTCNSTTISTQVYRVNNFPTGNSATSATGSYSGWLTGSYTGRDLEGSTDPYCNSNNYASTVYDAYSVNYQCVDYGISYTCNPQ